MMLDQFTDTDQNGYSDWEKAFEVAGEFVESEETYSSRDNPTDIRKADPTDDVPLAEFTRADVVEIIGIHIDNSEGGGTWDGIVAGRLSDGRWFSLRAGCDYTGWDCQSGGHANVASTRDIIVRMGLDDAERKDLGL